MLDTHDHQPGFAKRSPNYAVVAQMGHQAPAIEGMTYARAHRAVLFARPILEISPRAHIVLMLLLSHLNPQDWAEGSYIVWPSNATLCHHAGAGHRTVTGALRELEDAALIDRRYTAANRRMSRPGRAEGGVSLAPLAARFLELESALAARTADHRESRAAAWSFRNDAAPEGANSCRLEQTHKTYPVNSVTDQVEPPARLRSPRPPAKRAGAAPAIEIAARNHPTGQSRKFCLEERQVRSTRSNSRSTNLDEAGRTALAAAVQAVPALAPYFAEADFSTASEAALIGAASNAVAGLMPDRNMPTHTWPWAVSDHGWLAILILAIAIGTTPTRTVYHHFGFLAKQPAPDLRANLAALLKRAGMDGEPDPRGSAAQIDTGPAEQQARTQSDEAPMHPQWSRILRDLAKSLSPATVKAWLIGLTFQGIEGQTLYLTAPSSFIRDRVTQDFAADIERAAMRAGMPVARVQIGLSS